VVVSSSSYCVVCSNGYRILAYLRSCCIAMAVVSFLVLRSLPSDGSKCHIAPTKRLFAPTSHFLFFENCACDLRYQSRLPSPWIGSHDDYSPTAPTAPSLRSLAPSVSLIRCELVQMYHHQPRARVPFGSMQAEVPKVVDAPTSLTLQLWVVYSLVSERAEPSTVSSHSLPETRWKSQLLA
jgi:hypothetical protein